MDHLRRGTLSFANLKFVVLDEADEMLRMGFIEDVEWILGHAPEGRQTALFRLPSTEGSAASRPLTLHDPVTIRDRASQTLTVPPSSSLTLIVTEAQKLGALAHVLDGDS